MANWRYIKPLKNEEQVKVVEKELEFHFDKSYVDLVKKFNGGRPPLDELDSVEFGDLIFKSFLSLNKEDIENIFKAYSFMIDKNIVPFAIDDNGNYYVFNKQQVGVFFLNQDSGKMIKICDSFKSFVKMIDPQIK